MSPVVGLLLAGQAAPAAQSVETLPAGPLGWLEATVLGVVEGLTEFLPISSTGHLIVAQRLLGVGASSASNTFAIGIQMGAITAILVLYWRDLVAAMRTMFAKGTFTVASGRANLLWQIAIAAVPAAVLGLLLDDWIDAHLFSSKVVAVSLVVGGVLLLWLEHWLGDRPARIDSLSAMSYRGALWIGLWQCLALVPGTSRAGATIAGALLIGLSRTAAAEFSFLVGLPILYGASGYKLLSAMDTLDGDTVPPLVIGTIVSFVSALIVVKPFVAFLRRNTFAVFAWYRIVVGGVLLALCLSGWLS